MPITRQTQDIPAVRLTYRSNTVSFAQAESRLRSSIQKEKTSPWWGFQEAQQQRERDHQGKQEGSSTFTGTISPPSTGSNDDGGGRGGGGAPPRATPRDRESFTAWVESTIGPHGFMYFDEYAHGSWLPLFAPPTSTTTIVGVEGGERKTRHLKCTRFILGNPLFALTMLRHDLDAGLCVPVEVCLVEEPQADGGGGVRVVWYSPRTLIAGYEGASPELVQAAEDLSVKLERLVSWVLRDEE